MTKLEPMNFQTLIIGLHSLYYGKWNKISKTLYDLDLISNTKVYISGI